MTLSVPRDQKDLTKGPTSRLNEVATPLCPALSLPAIHQRPIG
jgi:hypothetical protein